MKSIRLILALLVFSSAAFSQACAVITSAKIATSGPDGSYQLNVSYTASGQKHIDVSVFCGSTVVFTDCIDAKKDGSYSKTFTCTGNTPTFALTPYTGGCGGGTACSSTVTQNPSAGPMPVKMSEFVAQRKNDDVLLTWKTEMELNSSHFDILKSSDNLNFDKIGTVSNLAANSNNVHSYSFTDYNNTSKSVTYYKLKIVDIDDRITYSEIKNVKGANSDKADFVVFPNPAGSTVTISGISEPTLVQILDNSGRVLKFVTLTSNTLDLSGIQNGNYILRIKGKTSEQAAVRKLTVIN